AEIIREGKGVGLDVDGGVNHLDDLGHTTYFHLRIGGVITIGKDSDIPAQKSAEALRLNADRILSRNQAREIPCACGGGDGTGDNASVLICDFDSNVGDRRALRIENLAS